MNKVIDLGSFVVDVKMIANGVYDVYIAHEGSSGEHYTNVTADRIGELLAGDIECISEVHNLPSIEEVRAINIKVPKYYQAAITWFDENNIPETKKNVCIKAYDMPCPDDFKECFEDIFNAQSGDEIRNIEEISEEDAMEEYAEEICDLC